MTIDPKILKKVRDLELRTGRLVDDLLAGAYQAAFKGRGVELLDLREYAPGDEIRSIDWNVTARTGRAHVKTYREERALTVMLVVDASASTRFGTTGQEKLELAAEVSALVALSAIRSDDKIGLLIFTDAVETYVPPKKGKKHVLRVLRELFAFRPKGRGTRVDAALEYLLKVQRRRAVVFLLSDLLATGHERALALTARRHDLIVCRTEDPREKAIPSVGLVRVRDPETDAAILLDTSDPHVRARFEAAAAERDGAATRMLRRLAVDHVALRTGAPFLDSFRALFRARARRRSR